MRKPECEQNDVPIIFIHGACHSAWCWTEHFQNYFADKRFESHAVSLSGHGNSYSCKNIKLKRISDYVNDIRYIASKFDNPPILIGHSMGGYIAQKYALKHKAYALVLMNSVAPSGFYKTILKLATRHPLRFLKSAFTFNISSYLTNPQIFRDLYFSENTPKHIVSKYNHLLQDESYMAFLDMLFSKLPKTNFSNLPILVIGGENDKITSLNDIKQTAKYLNTKDVKVFADMAHDMMLESEWQSVADFIIAWLNGLKS